MHEVITLANIDQAVDAIRKRTSHEPQIAMILGSGLGELANSMQNADTIPFADIPHMPVSTVAGHVGQLVIGTLEGKEVMFLQGRVHTYEGYSIQRITLPIRIMQRMGIESLILTNAAGAINPEYQPGDLMMIIDHINLIGMVGFNPLMGPNIDEIGDRFPDMSQVYDREYMALLKKIASEKNIKLHEGVYAGLSGPSFESPAELRFLHTIGADAVGMSTTSEAIVARHGKMRVLGISGISNKANLDGSTMTSHEEVLEAGKVLGPKLKTLILEFLSRL